MVSNLNKNIKPLNVAAKTRPAYLVNSPLIISRKQQKSITFFWYGFILYTITTVLILIGNKYLNGAACQAIQMVALVLMIVGASDLMRYKFDDEYLKNTFTIYLFYSLTVVARGQQFDYGSLKTMLLDGGFGILPYLAPFIVLFPRNFAIYKKAFTTLLIFGIAFIIFDIVYADILLNPDWMDLESQGYVEAFSGYLALPAGFILITFAYHKKKLNIFAFAVLLVAIYFLLYRARRGTVAICLASLAAAGMVYLIYTKRTVIVIIASVFLIAISTTLMSGIKMPGMLSFIMARKDEDTRSGVEQYMYASMTTKDWIIGKGINGKYFCPTVINLVDQTYDRPVIETGYLQIILKGGIISLVLLLLILLPAVYKGFFDSKNILAKGASMFILLWVVSLYPTIGNEFNMKYLLIWICVGICYSKQIRYMPDVVIKNHFKRLK